MRWLGILVVSFCLFDASGAAALRCGTYLINVGDSRAEVRARCGDPADISVRVDSQTVHQEVRGGVVSQSVSVVIESWTLNFGPQRFMQRIEFMDGVVRRIETLGRGYPPEQLGAYGRNIHTGETRDRVRASWGEPAERSVRVVSNATTAAGAGASVLRTAERTVEIETWVFNFGPLRFMRRVVFEDGRVVRIQTLGRGF